MWFGWENRVAEVNNAIDMKCSKDGAYRRWNKLIHNLIKQAVYEIIMEIPRLEMKVFWMT